MPMPTPPSPLLLLTSHVSFVGQGRLCVGASVDAEVDSVDVQDRFRGRRVQRRVPTLVESEVHSSIRPAQARYTASQPQPLLLASVMPPYVLRQRRTASQPVRATNELSS
jgi:hypothetical protein